MHAPIEPRKTLWAPRAWLPEGWAENVMLRIGPNGHWSEVQTNVASPPAGAEVIAGALLPGLVDAHSHAFQRAFAGLAERRTRASDTFWSWRDRMYGVAQRVDPEALRHIASQLYIELLRGGYTQVCEFHYLQHDIDGRPYADPLAMSWALAEAAQQVGIGLTLLPVLYERAGFAQPALRPDQRRFAHTAAEVWGAAQRINGSRLPLIRAGLAVHSLRAAAPQSIATLLRAAANFDGPIHIHVSEQTAEVDDCLAATGLRPIAWLAAQGWLDPRWQLVHATHTQPADIESIAASGAGVVLCPTTEANLGDGVPDLPGMLSHEVPLTIGSDSQINRDWREEVRWLDYAQRLVLRERNTAADPQSMQGATAARLWALLQQGCSRAAGMAAWGLRAGARADALVLDLNSDALLGIPPSHTLDALVFSSPAPAWERVMVAGRWVLRGGHHTAEVNIAERFAQTMQTLWPDD